MDQTASGWRQRLARYWRSLVGIAFLLSAFGSAVGGANQLAPGASLFPAIALFLASLFVSVFIHELGHAAAALSVGWRVHVISVFSIGYYPALRAFHRAQRTGSADVGGFVFATPPLPDGWGGLPAFWFVTGGVVANAIGAAVALFVVHQHPYDAWITAIAGEIAVICLLMGIVNLLPFWGPGVSRSDGARLIDLATRGTMASKRPVGSWLTGRLMDAIPLKDLDPDLLARFEREPLNDPVTDTALLSAVLLSAGRVKRLAEVLDASIPMREGLIPSLLADHAFAVAFALRDTQRATTILAGVPGEERTTASYWRARMVLSSLNGDHDEARRIVAAVRKAARDGKRMPDSDDESLFAAVERGGPLPEGFEPA